MRSDPGEGRASRHEPDARTAAALEFPAGAQQAHQGALLKIENDGISRTLSESAVRKNRLIMWLCTLANRTCTQCTMRSVKCLSGRLVIALFLQILRTQRSDVQP